MTNRFEIHAAGLTPAELKEVRRALSLLGGAATVARVRDFCAPGPVMTAIYTVLVAGFFVGLSVLFMPLMLLAAAAFVVVPLKVARERGRWLALLPPERDADLVALI